MRAWRAGFALFILALFALPTFGASDEVVIHRKPLPVDPDEPDPPPARAARIVDVVLVADEEGALPSHPLSPSFVLLVYGYHLREGQGPIAVSVSGAVPARSLVVYDVLADGEPGAARLNAVLQADLRKLEPERRQAAEETVLRAWSRGWSGVKIPLGPPVAGAPALEGALVRMVFAGAVDAGAQELSVRGVARRWTMPPLRAKPQGYCPRLLQRSIVEDFADTSLIRERVWAVERVFPPPSMLVHPLLSPVETDASRLERQIFAMPQLLGEATPSRSVAYACPDFDGVAEKTQQQLRLALVGEYYWSKRRLRDGVLITLQSLTALEKLKSMRCELPGIGAAAAPASMLAGISCRDFGSASGAAQICERLRAECRGNEDYAELVEQTDTVFRQWSLLELNRRRLERTAEEENFEASKYPFTNTPVYESIMARRALHKEQAAQIQRAQQLLESINPWIAHEGFRGQAQAIYARCARDEDGSGCEELRPRACYGIRAQARRNEERLRGHLDTFRKALDCLEGRACDMAPEALRNAVAAAPPLSPFDAGRGEDGASRSEELRVVYTNDEMRWADLRRLKRGYADEVRDAIADFRSNLIIMGLTFGMGEAAIALRTYAAEAGTAAAAAARAATAAGALEYGVLGADALTSLNQIRAAAAACSAVFADTTPLQSAGFDTLRGPSCTTSEYAGPQVTRGFQSCFTSAAVLEIATGLLPLIPDLKRRVADASLLRRSRAALGDLALLPAQENALVALFSRRLAGMSELELAQVVHGLRLAKFNERQIRDLLTALVPDVSFAGEELLRGLRGAPIHTTDVVIDGVRHTAALREWMGSQRLMLCTGCEAYSDFLGRLAKQTGSPQIRRELERLQDQVRYGIEGARLSPAEYRAAIAKFEQEMNAAVGKYQFIREELAARKAAADAMLPAHRWPGGGRDFIARARERPLARAGQPEQLTPIETLIENGSLAPEAYTAAADVLDRLLYLERMRAVSPALVRPGDLKRLEDTAAMLRANLPKSATLDRRSMDALLERFEAAKRAGNESMSGELLGTPARSDEFIARTTAEHRRLANSEEFHDPHGASRYPRLGEAMEADHVFPVARIQRIDGYNDLDWSKQAAVLQNESNISGLPAGLNKIKSDHDAAGFNQALLDKGMNPLTVDYHDWLTVRQACMEALLTAQIRCLARVPSGSDYGVCNPPRSFEVEPRCR